VFAGSSAAQPSEPTWHDYQPRPEETNGRAIPNGRHHQPDHHPQWAEIRNQALDRMQQMNAQHGFWAWERRRSQPIGPHGIAFLYWDTPGGGGRPSHIVVAAATRLVHDDPDVRDVNRLLYRLCQLGRERYLPVGDFDPRKTMSNRADAMSSEALFLGVGVSTLDTADSTWEQTQERASGPHQIPGRCFIALRDGSKIVIDREDDRRFGQVRVTSTGELNVVRGNPSRLWKWANTIDEPAALWEHMRTMGELCVQGETLRQQKEAAKGASHRRAERL
jgi:hypothetical protein